ncbi:hypothetical protein C3F09_05390 [candidate division GN15 bacterium]|uniref:Glycosyltransferase 2-like domain-containing protein n=1 Tax=candidate division GN15 bacterium TaxID=2072418 RepID=A0A855X740_9BACT|nr:MAG: hypothetical protein C3F09_05390 [candidate division GN15 bacterium]
MEPLLSIGMPVYNGERHVRSAVESLLGQTFGDFELLISDNASTDSTPDICRQLAAADRRVRYEQNQTNLGLIANYNRVFRLTRGRYFKWASSNDICDRHMVEECLAEMESHTDIVLCYPRTRLFTDDPTGAVDYEFGFELMEESPSERMRGLVDKLRLNNAMNGLIRRAALERTILLDNYLASDVNLLVELCLLGKFRQIPQALFYRRIHPSHLGGGGNVEELLRVYDPLSSRKVSYKFWRLNFEHFLSVWRASIPRHEKLRLFPFLVKKWYWDRGILWAELRGRGRRDGSVSATPNEKVVQAK